MVEEFSKTNLEEIKKNQEEVLKETTEIMKKYYERLEHGEVPEKEAQEKDTKVAEFIGTLTDDENFNPAEYRLYYVLTNQEPDVAEYTFDVPNGYDPYGPGEIEQFIRKTFYVKKRIL